MHFHKQNLLIFFFWIVASNLLAPFQHIVLQPYSERLDPHPEKRIATEILSLKKSQISGEELLKTIIYCLELPMIKWILCNGCDFELDLFLSEIQELIKAANKAFAEQNVYLQKTNIILIGIKVSSKMADKAYCKELCLFNFWKKFFRDPAITTDEIIAQPIIEESEPAIIQQAIKTFRLIWLKNGFFLTNKKLLKRHEHAE